MAKWFFEPGHTAAEFCVRHMMVTFVRGHFKDIHGTLVFDPEDPRATSVEATIEASGIWTGEAARDAHLKSEAFLDVEKHPKITFKGDQVEITGATIPGVEIPGATIPGVELPTGQSVGARTVDPRRVDPRTVDRRIVDERCQVVQRRFAGTLQQRGHADDLRERAVAPPALGRILVVRVLRVVDQHVGAGLRGLATIDLDTPTLPLAVAPVTGTAARLLMCHFTLSLTRLRCR